MMLLTVQGNARIESMHSLASHLGGQKFARNTNFANHELDAMRHKALGQYCEPAFTLHTISIYSVEKLTPSGPKVCKLHALGFAR